MPCSMCPALIVGKVKSFTYGISYACCLTEILRIVDRYRLQSSTRYTPSVTYCFKTIDATWNPINTTMSHDEFLFKRPWRRKFWHRAFWRKKIYILVILKFLHLTLTLKFWHWHWNFWKLKLTLKFLHWHYWNFHIWHWGFWKFDNWHWTPSIKALSIQ